MSGSGAFHVAHMELPRHWTITPSNRRALSQSKQSGLASRRLTCSRTVASVTALRGLNQTAGSVTLFATPLRNQSEPVAIPSSHFTGRLGMRSLDLACRISRRMSLARTRSHAIISRMIGSLNSSSRVASRWSIMSASPWKEKSGGGSSKKGPRSPVSLLLRDWRQLRCHRPLARR